MNLICLSCCTYIDPLCPLTNYVNKTETFSKISWRSLSKTTTNKELCNSLEACISKLFFFG